MDFSEIITFLFIGIGLSFDSFAVSVSCGMVKKEIQFSQGCVFAFSLAFFQALFPAIGWFIGKSLQSMIALYDHWIAFFLLLAVGIKMIIEGLKKHETSANFNPLKPVVMLGLSVATSIDALVVGLSYGFLETKIFLPVIIIGSITFIASMLGMLFGKNIPEKRSHQSIILGGIILIAIGTKILIEHLG